MSPSFLGGVLVVLAVASHFLIHVDAHSNGVGSCAAGFDKFPVGTEHNYENTTRPGGLLNDNYGDVAASGMSVTLGETQLQRPSGSDQFHYTGECTADYLCGKCQGACEDDSGCAEGLTCMVRNADEAVPGCSGTIGLWDGTNYCYDPAEAVGRHRQLQGQEAQVDATFQVGTPYTLKLEAPVANLFKGFMFRLEGQDGQDLSGAIETVSENMQVIESAEEMDDIAGTGVTILTMCAATVAAVCHTEAAEKDVVEATVTFPQAGKASLEVTVMVGEHQWYLTNYVLQVDGSSTPTESPPPSSMTESPPPSSMTESPPLTEGETTSGTRHTVLSLFATVVLVGLGLALY
eukprot:CAMPEP_0202507126 /NCGR_PEP_ID=MMETSP1361-20130828/51558_1 /ASSEMBLY_ACC=CAM_ASM_000849 /TAXON_ID=210615 /ORGANISM="Staurosira complex sp., Strain CCMP2646" /LENGTH=347 /DNA_ID=CAMNT_0049141229 /DNA_START=24 /DNA_END=1067 /DNA_ORIENTATION=+